MIDVITGSLPWAKPSCEDCCFNAFLEEPNYLRDHFPISEEVEDILLRIFRLNPNLRITLSDLRRAVLNIEKFHDNPHTPSAGCTRFHASPEGYSDADTMDVCEVLDSPERLDEEYPEQIPCYSMTPTTTARPGAYKMAPAPECLPAPRFSDGKDHRLVPGGEMSDSESEPDDPVVYPRPVNPVGKVGYVDDKQGTGKITSGWKQGMRAEAWFSHSGTKCSELGSNSV